METGASRRETVASGTAEISHFWSEIARLCVSPMSDDDFKPKLGRKRGKDGKKVVKYGGRILAAARLAGTKTGVRSRRFDGTRIGRGASMGRLLSSRDRLAGFRGRRAVVKASLIRLQGKAGQVARAHMRYIQRDGTSRGGERGQLYSATEGKLVSFNVDAYMDLVANRPSPHDKGDERQDEILSISVGSPTTAHARVKDVYLPKRFVDELTFVHLEGKWQIVSKVWHFET